MQGLSSALEESCPINTLDVSKDFQIYEDKSYFTAWKLNSLV